jgi:hypothetical protein
MRLKKCGQKKPIKHSMSRKVFRMYFSFRHGISGLSQEELHPCRLSLKECFAAQIPFQLQNALCFARVFRKDGLRMSVLPTLFSGFVPVLLFRFTAALADLKEGQDFFESNFFFQTHHDP